jgi:hypothetical protein
MTMNTMIDEARRMLGEVPNGRRFMLKDGAVLSSVRELYRSLKSMDEDVFSHHVRDGRNDFGNWVKDVFKDYQLANDLFASKTKSECLSRVGSRIYQLEKMTAAPDKVVLRPAPAVPVKPKHDRKKKSRMDVDPAELEKTIQEINRRYWEKKKLENAAKKKEEEDILRPLKETVNEEKEDAPETPEVETSVEDLLETYEPDRLHKTLIKDARTIFKASTVKDTASDVKKIFARDRKERAETEEVLKSVSAKQNPKKDAIIAELQKAHRMETREPER